MVNRSHGIPLESYELTKEDHRRQREAEMIRRHVNAEAERWTIEEAADPELKRARQDNVVRVLKMMASWPQTPDHDLMRWRVRLYCGHVSETIRHRTFERPTLHGSSSEGCTDCGLNPATIVAYEPIGLKAEPSASPPEPVATPPRPTRKQLERRVTELEAELTALKTAPQSRSPRTS
ncbi:hypothetical protein [Nocardia asteroides]|uniref:hypothetical protein n=1 Tax=Nocardia asteroides TaxID=1824 RepID=UPI001E2EE59E|nr:hypothetical protein [Nocardia asteroides]UGT54000.1 hypothetical protein LTT85_25585 [Nocardia asteroides]